MSILDQPPLGPHGLGPGDLDTLLRTYFQRQLPQPWPDLQPPASPTRRPAARPLTRSRLALAACVLALLTGQLWLSGSLPEEGLLPPGGTGGLEASRRNLEGKSKVQPAVPDAALPQPEEHDWIPEPDGMIRFGPRRLP